MGHRHFLVVDVDGDDFFKQSTDLSSRCYSNGKHEPAGIGARGLCF